MALNLDKASATTPDGFIAVADVDALVSKLFAEKAAEIANVGASGGPTTGLAQALAMAIAQLTDQGTGRKRVPPEEIQARESAHGQMLEAISKWREKGVVPEYRLVREVFLADQKIRPTWIDDKHRVQPQEIGWRDIPNGAMRPINQAAEEIFGHFSRWIATNFGDAPMPVQTGLVPPGGLVVRHASRERGDEVLSAMKYGDTRPMAPPMPSGDAGLMIKGRVPGFDQTRPVKILGSLAEPAREQA